MPVIRTIRPEELTLLDDFLYEAIFVPDGVAAPPRSIIEQEDLQVYIRDFGQMPDDRCLVAETDGKIVGAVWVRVMNDYGHIDDNTPSLAISLFKDYRNRGIGTELLQRMLDLLREKGYSQVSLSVQKANYALQMYRKAGFEVIADRGEEVLMVCQLKPESDMEFRPLRRTKQAATSQECESVLSSAQRGILAVLGENGYPYGLPINYVFLDGKIFFHCARSGHKLDAIRADDKVCFTVLSEPVRNPGEWWNCFTSVICFGHISEVTEELEKDRLLRLIGAKYFPEGYDLERDMANNARNALIMEISIDHMSGKHVREK